MRASAQYAFSEDRFADMTHVSSDGRGVDRTALFESIALVCAETSLALNDLSFLFNDLYDLYADYGIEAIFVKQMEVLILQDRMRRLAPEVMQKLIMHHCDKGELLEAEEIIWHVDVDCLDLDQVLSVCRSQGLYDALIHVFTQALNDFVSPVIELASLIVGMMSYEADDANEEARRIADAYKVFSYFSVVLVGRQYPSQAALPADLAFAAQSAVYSFLFCPTSDSLSKGQRQRLQAEAESSTFLQQEYPILRLFLNFDAEAFMDSLDIAMEAAYLSEESGAMTRQEIIEVMCQLSAAFKDSDICTFIDIFVARNIPKYPQFIKLSGIEARDVLYRLSTIGSDSNREDRQLAAESLLGNPIEGGLKPLFDLFEKAGFFHILQRAYRREQQWDRLLVMLLKDPDVGDSIFAEIQGIFTRRPRKAAVLANVADTVMSSVEEIAEIDVRKTARLIDAHLTDRHADALRALDNRGALQYAYLKCFLVAETSVEAHDGLGEVLDPAHLAPSAIDLYVTLMTKFEPTSMVLSLDARDTNFFDLDHVKEATEATKVYDAYLWVVNKTSGSASAMDALDRIVEEEGGLLLSSALDGSSEELASGVSRLKAALSFAIRLSREASPGDVEQQWYRVLHALVDLTHSAASMGQVTDAMESRTAARDLVQDCLSALIVSASAEQVSFPVLFRRLVSKEDESSTQPKQYYAEVRSVFESMTTAYRLRTDEMSIANRLFDRDISVVLHSLARERKRGWRPSTLNQRCARCNGELFGKNVVAGARPSKASAARRTSRNSMRRKSSMISIPSRPASPYLGGFPSPSIDKGKSPAREFRPLNRSGSLDEGILPSKAGANGDGPNFNEGDFFGGTWNQSSGGAGPVPADLFPAAPKYEDQGSYFSLLPQGRVRAASLAVPTSPQLQIMRSHSISAATPPSAQIDEEGESESEDESTEELMRQRMGIIVSRSGEAWHQLCAPRSLLDQQMQQDDAGDFGPRSRQPSLSVQLMQRSGSLSSVPVKGLW